MDNSYESIGISDADEHPGKPPSRVQRNIAPLGFDHRQLLPFTTRDRPCIDKVVDASRILYTFHPPYDDDNQDHHQMSLNLGDFTGFRNRRISFRYQCKDLSVAFIARTLLNASDFQSVLPIRLE